MQMTRRSFLKTLAALAGVSAVPELGFALPSVPEPIKWMVQENDFGFSHGVGATWNGGLRHAVLIQTPSQRISKKEIEYCKQALRQWYFERHALKR